MSILNSTNPTDWGSLDGIYIDESSPPPSVTGVPANTAILVGQFERGSNQIQSVGSVGQLYQLYGNNLNYSGLVALQNKQFGLLKVIRVIAASGSANAALSVKHSSSPVVITFTALWAGAYGNNLQVTVASGSTSGSKYTIHDANPNAVWPDEIYDNVDVTAAGFNQAALNAILQNSNLVSATLITTANNPTNASAANMTSGSDGTIANTDYQTAIVGQSQGNLVGNILFSDFYDGSNVIAGYIQTSLAATTDKMGIICGAAGDSVSTSVTTVASFRDVQGRMIYAYPYVYTTINGLSTLVNPASFYASLLSQIAPNIDPAYAANAQYLQGIEALDANLQRSDYINLENAGISAFEVDASVGIKVKSGVVTQIANSSLIMVFRRRMADYIVQSLAQYLVNYQNAPNSQLNQSTVGAAISAFNRGLETSGLVPSDAEVSSGKASLIDVTSLNTDESVASGYFKIIYKRRIYSSMRFIVLQAEIGASVVVTESSG
jgi:hypothetical protein